MTLAHSSPKTFSFVAIAVVLATVLVPIALMGETSWMVVFPLSTLAICVYFAAFGPFLKEMGLRPADPLFFTLLRGVGYGVALFLIFKLFLEPGVEWLTGVERDLSRLDELKGSVPAMLETLVIVWLTAALYEEIFYRSFLIRALARTLGEARWTWVVAVLASAALFALAHGYQGPAGWVVTGVGALALSLIYLKRPQNLWIPVIAHGVFDSGTVLLAYLGSYRQFVNLIIGV